MEALEGHEGVQVYERQGIIYTDGFEAVPLRPPKRSTKTVSRKQSTAQSTSHIPFDTNKQKTTNIKCALKCEDDSEFIESVREP